MEPNALLEHLTQLHQELAATKSVDERSNQLLRDIMDDIKRLTERAPAGAALPPTSLADRLEQIAVRFEADHPTVAASARRLVDLLGKIGL